MQPSTLSDLESEVADAWPRIMDGTAAFDRITREATATRSCTLKDVRKAFSASLSPASAARRCLTLEVHVGAPTGAAVGGWPQRSPEAVAAELSASSAAERVRGVGDMGEREPPPPALDSGVKQHVVGPRRGSAQVAAASGSECVLLHGPYAIAVAQEDQSGAASECLHSEAEEHGEGTGWQEWKCGLDVFAGGR